MLRIPKIRPVAVSAAYRRSVAVAALITVLIPFLYAFVVMAVAALTVAFAIFGVVLLNGLTIWIYAAVLSGGAVVVFILGRVFFVTHTAPGEFNNIDLTDHPELAGLLRRVCDATGAPMPSVVAVDLQCNASASIERPLLGLFTNRYRLLLGLPLLAIADRQVIAHVIAHEVGHFAQHGAMRVLSLVHWGHAHLSRLVETRDDWDIWVAERAGVSYFGVVMRRTASGGMWLSRRTLALLLQLSRLCTGSMMREMEYHADLYAIRVAGTPVFLRATETLAAGLCAVRTAAYQIDRSALEGIYPDDFPALCARFYDLISADDRKELARQARYTTGTGADSHPDDTDRIYRAEVENESGVLAEVGHGSALLTDFPALCRAVTRKHTGEDRTLTPVDDYFAAAQKKDLDESKRIKFFGLSYEAGAWLRFPRPHDATLDWRELIASAENAQVRSDDLYSEFARTYMQWGQARSIVLGLETDITVDWMAFELEPCDANEARSRMYAKEREHMELRDRFAVEMNSIAQRLLRALDQRGVLEQTEQDRFANAIEGLRALESLDDATTLVASEIGFAEQSLALMGFHLQNPKFNETLNSEYGGMIRNAENLTSLLESNSFQVGGKTLRDFAMPSAFDPQHGIQGFIDTVGGAMRRLRELRLQLMSDAAELALAVEQQSLGAAPRQGDDGPVHLSPGIANQPHE